MMKVRVLTEKVSVANLKNNGGGVNTQLLEEAEKKLNKTIEELSLFYKIVDIKVNHFTSSRHNNGGCDEVWVQYTILYD